MSFLPACINHHLPNNISLLAFLAAINDFKKAFFDGFLDLPKLFGQGLWLRAGDRIQPRAQALWHMMAESIEMQYSSICP